MAVLSVTTLSPGLVGVYPRLIYILTNDTLATITTTGYLNHYNSFNPGQFKDADMALVITASTPSATNVDSGFLQVNYASGNWSLIPTNNPGDVTLPTIANHIATYTNTTGGLSEDPTTAISGGNIQAGLSGTAGYVASFPSTAATGSLRFQAASNAGNTVTAITNASFGQATTITIPDPGVATATFVLSDGGTQHISSGNFQVDQGNLIAGSSGHAGTLILFPSTAANGTLIIAATNAGGAFNTTISNGIMGQSTVVTVVDPGATTANFILSKNATVQQITSGNLQVSAGSLLSGSTAGGFVGLIEAFPTTASSGFIAIQAAVNGSGNFGTIISNATTQAQSQVVTIPDVGGTTGALIAKGSAALVSGNFVKASGTAGVVVDGGAALHAGVTSAYGGGSTSNAFTVTGMASSWIVTASNLTSTNSVSITKVVPSTNTLTVTWSADPGSNTTVNWIAVTAGI